MCNGCNDFMPFSVFRRHLGPAHLHPGLVTKSISIVDSGKATSSRLDSVDGRVLAMQAHRFRDLVEGDSNLQISAPTPQANGFMACPILIAQALQGGVPLWQVAIYQLAFEQAQAAQKSAQAQRALLPSLN
jgi:hypothetical protein